MLAFDSPDDDTLDSSPPAAIAPAATTIGPAPPTTDAPGPLHVDSPRSERNATFVRLGPAIDRFPTATDALPANSPYKLKGWLLLQLQRDLALALRRIIADSHLADKLYGDTFAMLVLIQDFIDAHMAGPPQATITANFARLQIVHTPMIPTSSNCTHAFLESVSKYLEVSQFCPTLCNDADLVITLNMFLDHLPEKLGSELRTQILMYKSSHQSGDAADSDDDNASSTPRRLLLQPVRPRAGAQRARQVRSPQSRGAQAQRLDRRPRLQARADRAVRSSPTSSGR